MTSAGQPTALRLIVAMGLAGFLSGMALVGAYLAATPQIQRNQAEDLRRAVFKVLPEVQSFEAFTLENGVLRPGQDSPGESQGEAVYQGRDANGDAVGFAIPASGPGFQDRIHLLFGFDPEQKLIVGMEVLQSRETPGLGDKIIFDGHFKSNFLALRIEPELVAVKKGSKTKANEVDCISGATISSKAVVQILNQSVRKWSGLLAPSSIPVGDEQTDELHEPPNP